MTVRAFERDFEVGAGLEGRHFDVDAQAIAIGIGRGAEGQDLRLGGGHAEQVVFGEEKFHGRNYNQLCRRGWFCMWTVILRRRAYNFAYSRFYIYTLYSHLSNR